MRHSRLNCRAVWSNKIVGGRSATNPDIFFHCEHCKVALVANRLAAGMNLNCQRCDKPTAVPRPPERSADAMAQLQDIERRLTENESQRAEVTGYINQLSIQLHRWRVAKSLGGQTKSMFRLGECRGRDRFFTCGNTTIFSGWFLKKVSRAPIAPALARCRSSARKHGSICGRQGRDFRCSQQRSCTSNRSSTSCFGFCAATRTFAI